MLQRFEAQPSPEKEYNCICILYSYLCFPSGNISSGRGGIAREPGLGRVCSREGVTAGAWMANPKSGPALNLEDYHYDEEA